MKRNELFRKESLEALSSPERLTEYLKVTNVPVWILLVVIFLLILGFIAWAMSATLMPGMKPIDFLWG